MSKIIDIITSVFSKDPEGLLGTVTGAIDNQLTSTASDVKALDLEYLISSATGDWLDEYSSWFGVIRRVNETDESLRSRVFAQTARPSSTIVSLQQVICDYYNMKYSYTKYQPDDIEIQEMYEHISSYSKQGTFSGDCKYADGTYWRGSVTDIVLPESLTPELDVLIRNIKAAGTKIVYTVKHTPDVLVLNPDSKVLTNVVNTVQLYKIPPHNNASIFDLNPSIKTRSRSGVKVTWLDRVIMSADSCKGNMGSFNILSSIVKPNDLYQYKSTVSLSELSSIARFEPGIDRITLPV